MSRPVALGMSLSLLFVATASAQFARPPVVPPPRPPTPVVVPHVTPPAPVHPPTLTPTRSFNRPTGRPVYLVPINPGLLAVLGGTLTVMPTVPGGLVVYRPIPAVDREALAAVGGNAGTRPIPAAPIQPLPAVVNAPPVANNNGPNWAPWVFGGGVGVAAVAGLAVALRARGGRVRVVGVPPGEAPAQVRQAWVGLDLPTLHKEPRVMPTVQVATGAWAGERFGYAVDGRAAVRALAEVCPEAADWWRTNLPVVTTPGYQLVFPADVCERIA